MEEERAKMISSARFHEGINQSDYGYVWLVTGSAGIVACCSALFGFILSIIILVLVGRGSVLGVMVA